MMGIPPEATCSVDVQRKVVAAATEGRSYQNASKLLVELAGLRVSTKRCQRIAQRVGSERVREREAQREAHDALPLSAQQQAPAEAPSNSWSHRVAAVLVDGGRAQKRDERWGQPRAGGERVSWWREPKVACLATFAGRQHSSDPLPEVPDCLVDPLWVIPRVKEIKAASGIEPIGEAASVRIDQASEPPPRWSPEPLVRSVVATFQPYEQLGRLARVAAYHRGFAEAERKVFLGDGHLANWGLHERYFSRYTAVTDLMHALAYVYQAALVSTPDMETCWDCCRRWITWIWRGQVGCVLSALEERIESAEGEIEQKLQESLTYLRHNAARMKYDEYRQAGLPITTTLIESTIKQINRRMKGTEKFWDEGAEPQLQLCADRISETVPLAKFWADRESQQTGFRKSRAST